MVGTGELGRRIRAARSDRGLTLKQLEAVAGLSATHLSDIERGNASPTIGALRRIARALERDVSWFLDSGPREEVLHLPREACRTFSPCPGVDVEILSLGIAGSRMFSYRVCFAAGRPLEATIRSRSAAAEVCYTVVHGTVEADPGDGPVALAAGDALQASMLHPHRLRASGVEPVEVILVATHRVDLEAGR
jgi:transcriptional regulator with XRE-family HTH domain